MQLAGNRAAAAAPCLNRRFYQLKINLIQAFRTKEVFPSCSFGRKNFIFLKKVKKAVTKPVFLGFYIVGRYFCERKGGTDSNGQDVTAMKQQPVRFEKERWLNETIS